jgi:hypothetical protein
VDPSPLETWKQMEAQVHRVLRVQIALLPQPHGHDAVQLSSGSGAAY